MFTHKYILYTDTQSFQGVGRATEHCDIVISSVTLEFSRVVEDHPHIDMEGWEICPYSMFIIMER